MPKIKVLDPIKHVSEPKGIKTLQKKLDVIENRLTDFSLVRTQVITQWRELAHEHDDAGRPSDAFVINTGCDIVAQFEPRVAYIKLTEKMKLNKLPLFRDYYRRIRSDVVLLQKIVLTHKRAEKIRKQIEEIQWKENSIQSES